jgi:transposase
MGTRTFKLNKTEVAELQCAYQNSQDGATRTRYQAVRLYGVGYPVAEIMDICGCSQRSLQEWCQRYRAEGLSGLLDHRVGGNRARLLAMEVEELSQLLHCYTPGQLLGPERSSGDGQYWSIPDLQQVVEQRYGVRYQSLTSYRTLFARCEFSYQRATKQYKSRNEVKVMDFEEALEKNS